MCDNGPTETILEEDTETPFCLLWSKLICTVISLFHTETFTFLLIKCNYCSQKQQPLLPFHWSIMMLE